jgi:hypothetical protein
MKNVFATLRFLIADYGDVRQMIREYDIEAKKAFTKAIMKKIVIPQREKVISLGNTPEADKLSLLADGIESKLKTFSWVEPILGYAKQFSSYDFEEILSDFNIALLVGEGRGPAVELLPNAVLKQNPDLMISWIDIQKYWFNFSRGLVVLVIRRATGSGRKKYKDGISDNEFIHQKRNFVNDEESYSGLHDNHQPIEELSFEEELSGLKRTILQKAKNPEERKLFGWLLEAIIDNDYFSAEGKKKFNGILMDLPREAPNQGNEEFWRAVWDKMRPHVCSFFTKLFSDNDVLMTNDQKKVVCSSEDFNMVVERVAMSTARKILASYVLSAESIKDSITSGEYLRPHAMVEEIRSRKNRQAMIDRIAMSSL